MTKALNGGTLYDVTQAGWLAACAADVKAGRLCAIRLKEADALAVFAEIKKRIDAALPAAQGAVTMLDKLATAAGAPALPTPSPAAITAIEVLAGLGALGAAYASPVIVAAVAHGLGRVVSICVVLPADLTQVEMQLVIGVP